MQRRARSGRRPPASLSLGSEVGDSYWGYEATIIRATKAQIKGIFLFMYYIYIIMYIYIYIHRHGHKLELASVRKPLYFQEDPMRILSLPCQPCVYFKQHPSSTWTTFLATASARETSSCLLFWLNSSTSTFSPITIFWICRIQLLPQGCGEALHSLFCISFSELLEPVPIQPSLTWSHSVSFRLHYSPACASSQFSTSSTFSPRTFYWIFHMSRQDADKGEVLHIKSYFSLSSFAGAYTPRHSALKGRGNFHVLFSRD